MATNEQDFQERMAAMFGQDAAAALAGPEEEEEEEELERQAVQQPNVQEQRPDPFAALFGEDVGTALQTISEPQTPRTFNEVSREREVSDDGIFGSLGEGLTVGLLDSFRIVPGVDGFLDEFDEERSGIVQKGGFALGYLAGFLVPGSAVLKVSTKALKAGKLLKTADAFTDLGVKANAIRGAGAGALLGIGTTQLDEGQNPLMNAVIGAGLGGVGDVVAFPLFRAVSGGLRGASAAVKGRFGKMVEENVVRGPINAQLTARAMSVADQLYPVEAIDAGGSIARRHARLREGIEKVGFGELRSGDIRFMKTALHDTGDTKKILEQLSDEIDFEIIPRTIKSEGDKSKVADVIITPKGEMDQRLVAAYKENAEKDGIGWIPGQRVRHVNGNEKIIIGRSSAEGKLKVQTPGFPGSAHAVEIERLVPTHIASWTLGPKEVENASELWAKFVNKEGLFVAGKDWYETVDSFLSQTIKGITTAQRENMVDFFAAQQRRALEEIAPQAMNVLKKLRGQAAKAHPEGKVHEFAAQNGYLVEEIPAATPGEVRIALRDVTPGTGTEGKSLIFSNPDDAVNYLRANPRKLPDVLPSGAGIPYNHLGIEGTAVQRPWGAATAGGIKWPLWLPVGKAILPRESFFREVNDIIIEQTGRDPGIFRAFAQVNDGLRRARNSQKPWIERLAQIRGGFTAKTSIREESSAGVVELLSTPRKEWPRVIKRDGLNKKEQAVAADLVDMMDDLFAFLGQGVKDEDGNIIQEGLGLVKTTGREFMQDYWPHMRSVDPSKLDEHLEAVFKEKGKKIDQKTVGFFKELMRTGEVLPFDNDPFVIPTRLIRGIFSKLHVNEPMKEAMKLTDSLAPAANKSAQMMSVKRGLEDYLKLSYGQNPETFVMLRESMANYFENLGMMNAIDERTFDRLVSSFASLNYGAFMSFRVGLAIRNATQTVMTTLPMLQDPIALAKAYKAALSKEGRQAAIDGGALTIGSSAAPMEDAVFKSRLFSMLNGMAKGEVSAQAGLAGKLGAQATQTIARMEDVSAIGLGSRKLRIGDREIQVGLYTKADEFNRVVSYWGQRIKTEKHMNPWIRGEITREQFDDRAGLNMFGESIKSEFHRIYSEEGKKRAVDFLGRTLADETQWIYSLGAGPAWMSHGVGRIMGMYGTWPSWYAAHWARGIRAMKRSPKDGAKFLAWSAASLGSLMAATTATGINLNRWSPLNSLEWAGGPGFDWMKDFTNVWAGRGSDGTPSPTRALSLGERGIRDRGSPGLTGMFTQFDPRPGHGLDIVDFDKFAFSFVSPFVPGSLFMKDLVDAAGAKSPTEAILDATGLPEPIGMSWPSMHVR